jgi:hypothetical protein
VLDAGAKNYTLSDPPVLFPRIEPAPGAAPAAAPAKPAKQPKQPKQNKE